MRFARLIAIAGLFGLAGCAADLIVLNARVWTADGDRPEVTAFAVREGRFVCVGNAGDVRAWRGARTRVIDAGGRRVIPGLCDAHLHLISGGLQLARLNLRDVADRAEFIARIAERAASTAPGEWILGGRWSTESWPDATQPSRDWIDVVTGDVPLLLSRMDGHGALANSAALRLAGIDRSGPPDPAGGEIVRDPATGEPTGLLRDAAIDRVSSHAPRPSRRQVDRALRAAMREANRHGVTSVHTMSPWSVVAAVDRALQNGALTLRVRVYVSEDDWTAYIDRVKHHRVDDWLRICGFKQFMDGSLGSRTAYMAAPFADNPPDQPDRRGLLSAIAQREGRLQQMCEAVCDAGFTPAIHAIGDQANHLVLDIYEAVGRSRSAGSATATARFRIEHAQHLLPGDIARFASLGVIASMQPLHKADDGRYAEQAIGTARCRTSYAFRSLLDAGARVAFGSDWPVVTLDPFKGIRAAVTGRTLDGALFVPEQRLTVPESLRAYTIGGAEAAGDADCLGRIRAGLLADFVILEDDVLTVEPAALGDVRVRATYVAGRRVWPMKSQNIKKSKRQKPKAESRKPRTEN
ncbi:MAG: amidohydrolase [Phycisphaerae bacterium]